MKGKEDKINDENVIDIMSTLNTTATLTVNIARTINWLFNLTRYIVFFGYLISAAWMSLLLFYIYNEKLILLKIWASPFVIGLVLTIMIKAFIELKKRPSPILKQ